MRCKKNILIHENMQFTNVYEMYYKEKDECIWIISEYSASELSRREESSSNK